MSEYDDELDPPPRKSGSATPWVLFFLLLIGAGVGAYFAYGLLTAAQDRAASALQAADDATAKQRTLEAEKAGLEAAKASLEGRVSALEGEKGELKGEVAEKEAELAKLKETYDGLEDKMKEEIKKGEILLSRTGGKIQVDLVDKILFDSGQAELSPHGAEVLGRIGAILAKVEDRSIQVSGHTDDSPPSKSLVERYPTNWELSVARAVNVVRFLTEKASVPNRRVLAAGYGQFHPISTNANPEGRARNRRIEILLTPTIDAKGGGLPSAAAPAKPTPAAAKGKVVAAKGASAAKASSAAKAAAAKKGSKKPHR